MNLHENTIYLRKALLKAGITHKQAGVLVGRKKNCIAKYACEQGGRIIPNDLLEKLDDALFRNKQAQFKPKLKFLTEGELA